MLLHTFPAEVYSLVVFWKTTQGQGTYLANITFSVIWAKCMFQPASGDGACSRYQAPSLCVQEVARRGRVKLERAGPTWACITSGRNECFRRALRLRWGKRPTGRVVNQKQNKIHLSTIEVSRPEMHTPPSPYTFQTVIELSIVQPSSMHALHFLCFSRKREGFSGHSSLADQDLFGQTLRTRTTKAAFP